MLPVNKRKLELKKVDTKQRKIEYLEKTVAVWKYYKNFSEKKQKILKLGERVEKYSL